MFYRLFILFFMFMTLLGATETKFSNEELKYINHSEVKIAMISNYVPFSFNRNDKDIGFSYDLLKLISQKSGLKFKFEIDQWSVNLKKFQEKKVDMIDGISFKTSRLEFTNYTKPYYEIPLVMFSRKELQSYDGTLKSLEGKKIGLIKSIFYAQKIEDLGLFKVVEYGTQKDKIRGLAFGEVDLIIGNLYSVQERIKEAGYNNLKVLFPLDFEGIKKEDLRFGIVKENKILFSIISKSLDAVTRLEWNNLIDKWLGLDTKSLQSKNNLVNLTKNESLFMKNRDIKCVTTDTWAPLQFSSNNNLVGISIDYWELISKYIGFDIECEKKDTMLEVLDSIEARESDIAIASFMTRDKLKYANFSKSYITFPISIVTRTSENFISNLSFLDKKEVLVVKNSGIYDLVTYSYPQIDFIEVDSIEQALKLVSNAQAYALIDILPVLSYEIGKKGYTNLKISGTTEFELNIRVMVRDDYKELISIINKSIDLITEEEKNSIGKKWISVKFLKSIDYSFLINILIIFIFIFIGLYFLYKYIFLIKRYNKKLEFKFNREIKKNKEKDIQLLHQSRLAQMGEMISIIAHQWRQPLNAISATILNVHTHIELETFCLSNKKGRSEFIEFVTKEFDKMDNYIGTLNETLEHFRNFYKPNKKKDVVGINTPLENSLLVARALLKNNKIDLIEEYESKMKMPLFQNELVQVFLNLIKNSQDSFKENGIKNPRLIIRTKDLKDGISIEFEDNAGGISKSIIHQIFDPYFSTKNDKNGTGLGLYMARIIVEEHHEGSIKILHHVKGVSFVVFLPKKK